MTEAQLNTPSGYTVSRESMIAYYNTGTYETVSYTHLTLPTMATV